MLLLLECRLGNSFIVEPWRYHQLETEFSVEAFLSWCSIQDGILYYSCEITSFMIILPIPLPSYSGRTTTS